MRGRSFLIGPLMAAALVAVSTGARADVSVGIGINLPAPPALVVIPSSPVVYAPSVSANYFSYGGQFYVFSSNAWYVGPGYNGPWTVIAASAVPAPVLAVPVRYYRAPPPAWRGWQRNAPPRWGHPGRKHG